MRLIFGTESHSCAIHNFKNPDDSHEMPGGFLSDVNPVSNCLLLSQYNIASYCISLKLYFFSIELSSSS